MAQDDLLKENKEMENWRDEHGKPSFEYLQSLVNDGSVEALEKLRSIAEDLDVNFNSSTSVEELVGMIRASVRRNSDSSFIR